MAEELQFPKDGCKADIYEAIIPQISALTLYETDRTAALANVVAVLKEALCHFWVGFYLCKEEEEDKLVLNVFQGPMACSRIRYNKGVCGTSWSRAETIIVDDVESFDGHIACSSISKSEIVVPLIKNGVVVGVLDIDSDSYATFDTIDKRYLEDISEIITANCF